MSDNKIKLPFSLEYNFLNYNNITNGALTNGTKANWI